MPLLTDRQLKRLEKAQMAPLDKIIQSSHSYHLLENLQYSQQLFFYPPMGRGNHERVQVDLPYLLLNFAFLPEEHKDKILHT